MRSYSDIIFEVICTSILIFTAPLALFLFGCVYYSIYVYFQIPDPYIKLNEDDWSCMKTQVIDFKNQCTVYKRKS
jgi:hypothetical protein